MPPLLAHKLARIVRSLLTDMSRRHRRQAGDAVQKIPAGSPRRQPPQPPPRRSDNGLDTAITIRTMVLEGDQYSYQAGAGIVSDSRPDAEHEEVFAKSAALRSALSMAQEGL